MGALVVAAAQELYLMKEWEDIQIYFSCKWKLYQGGVTQACELRRKEEKNRT